MPRAEFGAYTQKLRIRAGLSQKQVADRLKLKSGQLVSNWERGVCYPPLLDLKELALMYNVNLRILFNQYCYHTKKEDWIRLQQP